MSAFGVNTLSQKQCGTRGDLKETIGVNVQGIVTI